MERTSPRARVEGLVVRDVGDEVLVYDLDRHKVHCLNPPAAKIWKRCDGKSSVAEIARLLETDSAQSVAEESVRYALAELARRNLLCERLAFAGAETGMSRRELVERLGLAAAVALPLVSSIVAPTPAQAASCLAPGSSCTTGAQCCSFFCNGGTCA